MQRSSYGERDYAFGQAMVRLRTSIGLTQAGLAELLGISRKAVSHWEVGDSYPKASHLQALLAYAVGQRTWETGQAEEEIRAFWRVAHQKVPLDERWLQEVLARPARQTKRAGEPSDGLGQDSAAASQELALWTVPYAHNPHFTGRDELLSTLAAQLAPPEPGQPTVMRRAALTQARVIKGLGGIGKTQTAVEYAYRARAGALCSYTLDRRRHGGSPPGELCVPGRAAAGRGHVRGEGEPQAGGSCPALAGAVPTALAAARG